MSSPPADPSEERFATGEERMGAVREGLEAFIREVVAEADADGVVIDFGGGTGSAVAATLAVDALGADRVRGLVLPCTLGTEAAMGDATVVADALGIDYDRVHLQPLLNGFVDRVTPQFETRGEGVPLGNAIARLRMACAYFVAGTTGRLVLGTLNRTELLLGRFTKYGENGADLLPLGDLYRTEARALARYLDVPEFVIREPPEAGSPAGRTDEELLGAPYETIDRILHRLADEDLGIDRAASDLDVDPELVRRIARRHATSRHKRARPPTPDEWAGRPRIEHFHDLELRFP